MKSNEKNIILSIILPVYNVEKYIERCVESILTQNREDIEIIIVDDGATDGSPQICDKYAEKISNIKVIHKQNGGLSSARNAGMDVANGKYIYFLDSDDWITEDAIRIILSAGTSSKDGIPITWKDSPATPRSTAIP